ncbi:MAG: MBL fold metallo-hydrolase [Bacteroidaceae bacterium]|nr:MBL fold metallo-hydrolase [Bacteroidaceae bacterium]
MNIKTFTFSPIEVNSYLLWDETKEAVLIDCGCFGEVEERKLSNFIEKNGLTLKHYLNTHLHFDHIFGNPFIMDKFGISAEASDGDWHWAENIAERVARFGIIYDKKIPALARVLGHNDEVTFGNGCTIKAIAVPGHSPGSLAYYVKEKGWLFSGDALFRSSIGRTDFPDSDHAALIANIKERLFTLPDDTVVYPGHDRSTTIGYEKEYNMFIR